MSTRSIVHHTVLACVSAIVLGVFTAHAEPNYFADVIRKTEPQPPAIEKKSFHLPPGFEIDLVASEPDIAKPINMAFDAKGRLWITQSKEYPFPAPTNREPRDAIQILSDFHPDGKAGKITTFAKGLNIPIGIYPYKDGAMGYSIPNIYHFRDTNHDGVADTKDLFLGKFSFDKDTHGMTSSFRRGFDGLFYANHGFNNTSTLTAKDGSTITMHSGNTYRLRMDGTHLEQFVWGRVNPFGLMFDPMGDLFSSDCETWPIYQILRGGYYPSFGAPDDGLGFAPVMMDHKHGSSAIAGLVYYSAPNFPAEYQDNIFVGNVMTCRLDRDSLEMHGSTAIAHEQPDFLSSDDPWFRPVNIEMGPDGALYMADFYNRIIGHYEVSLTHPGRDRERGRIWRIRYVGTNAHEAYHSPEHYDLTHENVHGLIRSLGNANLTIRMLAMSELTDRIGAEAIRPVNKMMHDKNASVWQRVHGMWVLYRLNALDPELLATEAHDSDMRLRVHAMRVFSELPKWTPEQRSMVIAALKDQDALVERCAADALGQHPDLDNMRPLLEAHHTVQADDTHLLYVIRMALRNHLRDGNIYSHLPISHWTAADDNAIADVSLAVPSAGSAQFLLRHLQKYDETSEQAATQLKQVARYLPETDIDAMADVTHAKFSTNVDLQLVLFKSIRQSLEARGAAMPERMRKWGSELAQTLLKPSSENTPNWHNIPISGLEPANPWALQHRSAADGKGGMYFSTLPNEKLTGMLRSRAFAIPGKLVFFIAGHDGPPDKPAMGKNLVRLCDATTGAILRSAPVPRNDNAAKVTWDLKDVAGQQGYLELVDGIAEGAWAWIAVGRFAPQVVPMPLTSPNEFDERLRSATELAGDLHLDSVEVPLIKILTDGNAAYETRYAAAKALGNIHPERHVAEFGTILSDGSEPSGLRLESAKSLSAANTPDARATMITALPTATLALQTQIATALASSPDGAESLLTAVADGKGSARLLQDRNLKERLLAAKPKDVEQRIAQLTKGLPPADEERQKVINARAADFNVNTASADRGGDIFKKNCMVCHAVAGQGAAVGPNLDGIGNRGVPRVCEDILDPSRNVDRAFRVTIFTLKDGDVQSGLFRREEGEVVIVAQSNGQEMSIPKKDIASRRESELSLMPDNFSQVIPQKDFNDLLAFLTTKATKAVKK